MNYFKKKISVKVSYYEYLFEKKNCDKNFTFFSKQHQNNSRTTRVTTTIFTLLSRSFILPKSWNAETKETPIFILHIPYTEQLYTCYFFSLLQCTSQTEISIPHSNSSSSSSL